VEVRGGPWLLHESRVQCHAGVALGAAGSGAAVLSGCVVEGLDSDELRCAVCVDVQVRTGCAASRIPYYPDASRPVSRTTRTPRVRAEHPGAQGRAVVRALHCVLQDAFGPVLRAADWSGAALSNSTLQYGAYGVAVHGKPPPPPPPLPPHFAASLFFFPHRRDPR